jgi:hypothetical protein
MNFFCIYAHKTMIENNKILLFLKDDINEDSGLVEQITWARNVLGLGETATLSEINGNCQNLLKKWHPDISKDDPAICNKVTKQILQAREILDVYCSQYKFSFSKQEVEKYLSPREWLIKRFEDEMF